MEATPTRYARRTAGGHIAYQILGSGHAVILDFGSGTYLSIDDSADEPHFARFLARLGAFATVVRFDPCAIGLSDTPHNWEGPSMEGWVADAVAVLDDAEIDQAVVFASVGASMPALVLAAEHPERVRSLILHSGVARLSGAPDYEIGLPPSFYEAFLPSVEPNADLSRTGSEDLQVFAPSLASDPSFSAWWSRSARRGARPDVAAQYTALQHTSDVRSVLPAIDHPVLVTRLSEGRPEPIAMPTYLADRLQAAQLVEVPGPDLLPFASGAEALVRQMEAWVTGSRPTDRERTLQAILFTDIVDSTAFAATAGDRPWKERLQDFTVLARREVEAHSGRWVKDTGDGSLSAFPGPRHALDCAQTLVALANQKGWAIRASVHFAEVEVREESDVGGIAVHLAARVLALAGPNQILVSNPVVEVLEGAPPTFLDGGSHTLKGIPGDRRVWRLADRSHPER